MFAIYIHWPFCLKKCPYCDFNSHVRDEVDHARWAAVLTRELEHYAALTSDRTVTSVFFGGGTPSLMRPETIAQCLDAIQRNWRISNSLEVSMEANPTSSEAEKFKAFRAAGVNRLSIGVQSLRDDDLKFLGREHSAVEAKRAVEMAASSFDRYSFDMMYGRPNQAPEDWQAELQEAVAMGASHISAYQLTIEEGTQFFTQAKRGDFLMPDDISQEAFYDVTQEVLNAANMPAYEISNHARAGEECLHNLTYWRYGEYLGIGAGAHGRFIHPDLGRIATRNHKAPEKYLELVEVKGYAAHPYETIENKDAAEEFLMVGLRLIEGVETARFKALFDQDLFEVLDARKVDQLIKENYLVQTKTHLSCTAWGLKTLNSVLLYLLG